LEEFLTLKHVVDLEPHGFQDQPYGSRSTTRFKVKKLP